MALQLIIRPAQLANELGASKTTLWRWRQAGILPDPVLLDPRLVGWEKAVIEQWIQSRSKMEVSL